MKKINYKKIISFVLWIIALSGLTASLAFVNKTEKQIKIQSLDINIENEDESGFVDREDIRSFFNSKKDSVVNNSFKNVDINILEKALNAHPAVENADLSLNINGEVKINITQRRPLVRVITMSGESYYIDTQTKLMPLSDKYSARVLVVNGFIFEPYARRYNMSVKEIENNSAFKEVSVLDDIYNMAKYITGDTLLNNLIQQMNINEEKEFELFPAIGDHKILFGRAEDIKEKFEKLKIFYNEGLNKTDNWNIYSAINLKYKNQVICTKK